MNLRPMIVVAAVLLLAACAEAPKPGGAGR